MWSLAKHLAAAPCIFMDCDGIIFDSNRFKLCALDQAMAPFEAKTHRPMMEYWRSNGGVSRYIKFDHYVRQIVRLRGEEAKQNIGQAISTFAEYSRAGYETKGPVEEALEFARFVGAQRLVVISGTDEAELNDVFQAKALTEIFPIVLGSPTTKVDHIRSQLRSRDCEAAACLFIGDGAGDFRAARECGVPFIFLAIMSEWTGGRMAVAEVEGAFCFETWHDLLDTARSI